MGRLDGKVAFITGGARGQGRAEALRFAREGAKIVAIDICGQIEGVPYPLASKADLDETVEQVRAAGGDIIAEVADVRDQDQLNAAVASGLSAFGHIDVVVANAGICGSEGNAWEISDGGWATMLDVNLTGVWRTIRAVVPSMIQSGRTGSIIITSSYTGLKGESQIAHYAATKHGVVGLMRSLAHELGPHNIRVNTLNPGNTESPMVVNDWGSSSLRPDLESPTRDDVLQTLNHLTLLDVGFMQVEDMANAALWLASDESRYVTGVVLPVDGGWYAKST